MKVLEAEKIVKKHDVDCWLITTTGIRDPNSNVLLSLRIPGRHFLVVTPPKQTNYLLTTEMERGMAEKQLKDLVEIDSYRTIIEMKEKVPKLFKGMQKIALNFSEDPLRIVNGLSHSEYLLLKKFIPDASFHSAAEFIYELRSIKNEEEIENHRNAAKSTAAALELIPDIVKPKMTELEVAAELEYQLRRDADGFAFDTIVAAGENSADPHYNTGKKKVQTASPLLIDVGIRKINSVSDCTWTYHVGKPTEDFLRAYKAVFEAKEIGIKALKANVICKDVVSQVRDYFQENDYNPDELFIHGLGHPIGFVCHDIGPALSQSSPNDMVTLENSVMTVEPGLYWRGKWGVRLEDDVVIRKNEVERLSSTPREP
ncbi:MAG: M24 family metallopeptidase [Promethearchaeota archaeon]